MSDFIFLFQGINANAGFVATCRQPNEWPPAVSKTQGLAFVAHSSASVTCDQLQKSQVLYFHEHSVDRENYLPMVRAFC